jgi:hypothetical protein
MRSTFTVCIVIALALAVAVGWGAQVAYTASIAPEPRRAGDGVGAVSGYAISGVHYELRATDPTLLESVSFNLDAPATDVTARIASHSLGCTATGLIVRCATGGTSIPVADVSALEVIAVA